jgi:hypothetical protein
MQVNTIAWLLNKPFIYSAFRVKMFLSNLGKTFTNCTLEYTLSMLDTTFREVKMENK